MLPGPLAEQSFAAGLFHPRQLLTLSSLALGEGQGVVGDGEIHAYGRAVGAFRAGHQHGIGHPVRLQLEFEMEGKSERPDHSPVCLEVPGSAQSAIGVFHGKPFADKGIFPCDRTGGKHHNPASCEH